MNTRYELKINPGLCDLVRVYDTIPEEIGLPQLPPSPSFVWYFSSNVNFKLYREIKQEIERQKSSHIDHVKSYTGGKIQDRCRSAPKRVDWFLIAIFALFRARNSIHCLRDLNALFIFHKI